MLKLFLIACLWAIPAFGEAHQHIALKKLLKAKKSHKLKPTQWSSEFSASRAVDFLESEKKLREKDRIRALPGQPSNVSFAQYSGYVTVDPSKGRALFYYFAEATENPSTKPLLLWLNGVANTLFLESPAGVGFSYSNTTEDYKENGDKRTAADSYVFLVKWFQRFPEYKYRDFYIAGESYAGFYIPELADTIINHKNKSRSYFINLKGIMVGNGIMNAETDARGMDDHVWTHALISDQTYDALKKYCNYSREAPISPTCERVENQTNEEIGTIQGVDIYAPLCLQSSSSQDRSNTSSENNGGSQGYDPCSENYIYTYLNTPEVQSALHANITALSYPWNFCSDIVSPDTWKDSPESVLPIYHKLISTGLKILIFSGDVDIVVPVTSTRYSINALKLQIETPWYPWMNGDEVGGYSVIYKGLTFATVRGAGHQVPTFQPARALTMVKYSLAGRPLPPPTS